MRPPRRRPKSRRFLGLPSFLAAFVAAFFMLGLPASASRHCYADRQDVVDWLAGRFQEARVSMALSEDGLVIEVFRNEDGSSWTIIVTGVAGPTCIISHGRAWEEIPFSLFRGTRI